MSWQDYVDHQLLSTKCVNQAAIVGHDGNVWASSPDFKVTQTEALKLIEGFKDPSIFQAEGVTIAGNRYIYLSGSDKIVRAKKLKVGVHCMKTKQAIVISTYADPIQPQQAASAVEGLGDYLVKCGY